MTDLLNDPFLSVALVRAFLDSPAQHVEAVADLGNIDGVIFATRHAYEWGTLYVLRSIEFLAEDDHRWTAARCFLPDGILGLGHPDRLADGLVRGYFWETQPLSQTDRRR
jgi:hypothetical protein